MLYTMTASTYSEAAFGCVPCSSTFTISHYNMSLGSAALMFAAVVAKQFVLVNVTAGPASPAVQLGDTVRCFAQIRLGSLVQTTLYCCAHALRCAAGPATHPPGFDR